MKNQKSYQSKNFRKECLIGLQVEGVSKKSMINKWKTRIIGDDQEDLKTLEQQIIFGAEILDQEQKDAPNDHLLKAMNKYLFETFESFFPKPEDILCSYYRSWKQK